MDRRIILRTFAISALVLSVIVLPGTLSVRAGTVTLVTPPQPWLPAGPAMDRLLFQVYVDQPTEALGLLTGQVDLTFTNITPPECNLVSSSLFNFRITVPCGGSPFAYRDGWVRVVNSPGLPGILAAGTPNFYSLLNMWNPSPDVSGTIRWGFRVTTNLNPYFFTSTPDTYVMHEIYDTLYRPNPANPTDPNQVLDWMTVGSSLLTSPPHINGVLRNDIFFHDGTPVTGWDVAFSYRTLIGNSAPQAASLALCVSGLGVPASGLLAPTRTSFNILLTGACAGTWPNQKASVGSPTIIPGRIWSSCGIFGTNTWDTAVAANTSPGLVCLSTVASTFLSSSYDPVAAGIMVGSGPFVCNLSVGVSTILGQPSCTRTASGSPATQAVGPGGTILLNRFGLGTTPGMSISGAYFRSSGTLALYVWTGNNGNSANDGGNYGTASSVSCLGKIPPQPFPCSHWEEGIGNPGGPLPVTLTQLIPLLRFGSQGYSWVVTPLITTTTLTNWSSLTGILPASAGNLGPANVGSLTLYEGAVTLRPATDAGCSISPANGPLGSSYPNGGYDC